MDDQNPAPDGPESGDQLPTPGAPAPEPDPAPEQPAKRSRRGTNSDDRPTRYAVYNATLEQYVGPVTTSKPSKADASALVPKGHKTEVREV